MRRRPGDEAPEFELANLRPRWQQEALCREYGNPADFFPGRGEDLGPAKAICETCPVRAQCLAYALDEFEDRLDCGVWGGTSPGERKRLRRQRRVGDAA